MFYIKNKFLRYFVLILDIFLITLMLILSMQYTNKKYIFMSFLVLFMLILVILIDSILSRKMYCIKKLKNINKIEYTLPNNYIDILNTYKSKAYVGFITYYLYSYNINLIFNLKKYKKQKKNSDSVELEFLFNYEFDYILSNKNKYIYYINDLSCTLYNHQNIEIDILNIFKPN